VGVQGRGCKPGEGGFKRLHKFALKEKGSRRGSGVAKGVGVGAQSGVVPPVSMWNQLQCLPHICGTTCGTSCSAYHMESRLW